MSQIITKTIDALQDINERVPGIEAAPHIDESPESLDTYILPVALTDISRGTEWGLFTDGRVQMTVVVSVYLRSFNQEYLGDIRQAVHVLADAFRDKYRDEATYLYDDGTQGLICDDELQAWIQQGRRMSFSGYTRLEFPLGSQKFYHGFTLTFGVVGTDVTCDEDNTD